MTKKELDKILELHKKWLNREADGVKANLREADLWRADLSGADLSGANLRWANLLGVNLKGADLRGADLGGANLDYSAWPLWCGTASSNIKMDERQAAQLLYHACIVAQQHIRIPKTIIKFIEKFFHRYDEVEPLT